MTDSIEEKQEFQILTFQINKLDMALVVDDVQEVLLEGDFQPVPLAPEFITGLFTLRGQIVTAMNLKARFNVGGELEDDYSIIVVKKGLETLGFIVDTVGDVVTISDSEIESLPSNFKADWKTWGARIIRLDDRIHILPDTDAIITN